MAERRLLLDDFRRSPALLAEALKACPRQMWGRRPSHDRWSNHEIVVHLADCELQAFSCYRAFIATDNAILASNSFVRYAPSPEYFRQSTMAALRLIRLLRSPICEALAVIPESVWTRTGCLPSGQRITLDEWFRRHEECIIWGIDEILYNLHVWVRDHRRRKRARMGRRLESTTF